MQSRRLLQTLNKQKTDRPPFWFMRQAGRYLPEYKELRSRTSSFLEFCYSPTLAAEATLQPIRRFNMDAAILFSDILVIPDALGMRVTFEEKKGPLLNAAKNENEIENLNTENVLTHLAPVFETIRLVKQKLPEHVTLIGFAGSPWTVACYMLEGQGGGEFPKAIQWVKQNPNAVQKLLRKIETATIAYLSEQIRAGAEVIQLFDSWASIVPDDHFASLIIEPTKHIITELKKNSPHIPIIGFPRAVGKNYEPYMQQTGVDAISMDTGMDLNWAKQTLSLHTVLQGNLDPTLLATDIEKSLAQLQHLVDMFRSKDVILNLGHGIQPHTPVEHVARVSEFIHQLANK